MTLEAFNLGTHITPTEAACAQRARAARLVDDQGAWLAAVAAWEAARVAA